MICKHVSDPIKAWRRENQKDYAGAEIIKPVVGVKELTGIAADQGSGTETISHQTEMSLRRNSLQLFHRTQKEARSLAKGNRCISIFFCSAGTIAEKLANKLHKWLKSILKDSSNPRLCPRSKPLDSLSASDLTAENILLLIVSSTGQGEIPPNGLGFLKICENMLSRRLMDRTQGFRFAVFGNGDSRYSTTYNGAAKTINDQLTQIGGCPLVAGIFQADTAIEPFPLSALKSWSNKLQPCIVDQPIESLTMAVGTSFVRVTPVIKLGQKYEDHQDRLLSTLGKALLVDTSPGMRQEGSLLVTFNIDNDRFEEMSCIQILPSNSRLKVNQALGSLCVKSSDRVNLGLDRRNPTYASFLRDYVDLELPFSDARCFEAVESVSHGGLTRASLSELSVQKILERLRSSVIQMSDDQRSSFVHDLCQDMPLLHTRTYSIASSQHYPSSCDQVNGSTGREVDIMVKILAGGRFSETFLKDSVMHASLRYRIVDSSSGARLRKHHLKPFIVIATGAGFGPVRCLLQWRMGIIRDALATGGPPPSQGSGISLFLGLKPSDVDLIVDVLNKAMSLNLIDVLAFVPSNPMKRRVYDDLQHSRQRLRNKLLKQEGMAFVCTNKTAAVATKSVVEDILGGRVDEMLGERYVEDVY